MKRACFAEFLGTAALVLGAWLAVGGCRGVQSAGCCRATASA